MSWGAQNRSKDAKTHSAGRAMSEKPELDLWPVQPYVICHIADLSSTDTNCTLLQPHNEIFGPLLKLGPLAHQLNDATPE
jgi:hypothetical protein